MAHLVVANRMTILDALDDPNLLGATFPEPGTVVAWRALRPDPCGALWPCVEVGLPDGIDHDIHYVCRK